MQSKSSVHAAPAPLLLLAAPDDDVDPLVPLEDPLDDVELAEVELDVDPLGPSPLTVVSQAARAARSSASASVDFMEGRLPC